MRAFMEREPPDMVLCGHIYIHEARSVDTIEGGPDRHPGPASADHYAIVDIDDGAVSVRLDR